MGWGVCQAEPRDGKRHEERCDPRVIEILAQVEESVADVTEALTMPKEVYSDAEFFEFELVHPPMHGRYSN